jgi:hypothetical protein
LLDLGVPVNYKHKLFGTALFAAIGKESEIASRLLLERGAIPDEYDLEWLCKQKSLQHLLYDYLNMMSREDFLNFDQKKLIDHYCRESLRLLQIRNVPAYILPELNKY